MWPAGAARGRFGHAERREDASTGSMSDDTTALSTNGFGDLNLFVALLVSAGVQPIL